MTVKLIVENAVQAKKEIEDLMTQGYTHDDIYIFAHDKMRGKNINDALDTEEVTGMGKKKKGFLDNTEKHCYLPVAINCTQ